MEILQTLGIALGLATLAGINLYLTVFVSGLAIQQGWIDVSQTYPELAILGHPVILAIAGTLYFLEFFADKIPWVDSLWDSVHTVIRPVGGALLAIRVLGTPDPVFDVIVALLGGSVTLMTHSVKAGTRLVANHSPEPFSNIALSLTEDAVVLGGLALIREDPVLALIIFSVVLMVVAYIAPKLFRAVKVHAFLIWKKIGSPAADQLETELPSALPHELEIAFRTVNLEDARILWAVPCISTAARGIPGGLFGYLVAKEGDAPAVSFVATRHFSHFAEELALPTYKVAHEPKFLSENVVFYSLEKKPKYIFLFARSQRQMVKAIVATLKERLAPRLPAPEMPARPEPLAAASDV